MNRYNTSKMIFAAALSLAAVACNSNPPRGPVCMPPSGHNLDQAMSAARFDLETGCEGQFDGYFRNLLSIAEGDPKKENKGQFSDFLLWANQEGLLSKRQARSLYNRYFGIKYVSMMGDYSVCSETCPRQSQVLREMKQELNDKELGLLKVSADRRSYQRAMQLFNETELVLEATCSACGPLE